MARFGLSLFLVAASCCVAAAAGTPGTTTYATADGWRAAFNQASNAYEGTLAVSFEKARRTCQAATVAPPSRRYLLELNLDSALRQAHDVLPFSRFAGHIAALSNKPPPLARLAALYTKEAEIVAPLSGQSPATPQNLTALICEAYSDWRQHGWDIYWANRFESRMFIAAQVTYDAAPTLAHQAIALRPDLQKSGATPKQAIDLVSITLGFG